MRASKGSVRTLEGLPERQGGMPAMLGTMGSFQINVLPVPLPRGIPSVLGTAHNRSVKDLTVVLTIDVTQDLTSDRSTSHSDS